MSLYTSMRHIGFSLSVAHGKAYYLLVTFNRVTVEGNLSNLYNILIESTYSLHSIYINKLTSYNGKIGLQFDARSDVSSTNDVVGIPSNFLVIEDSHIYNNKFGIIFAVSSRSSFTSEQIIQVKSSLITGSIEGGIAVNFDTDFSSSFPTLAIHLINTELSSNERNLLVRNCDTITVCNVTITKSQSTGLTLINSKLTINDSLFLVNNTGIDGGGIGLYENSELCPSSSTIIKLIGNYATQKGGGIYQSILLMNVFGLEGQPISNATFIFQDNTAAVVGSDTYNMQYMCSIYTCISHSIDQSTDAVKMCFCNTTNGECVDSYPKQDIFPGQNVNFSLLLTGFGHLDELSITNGVVDLTLNDGSTYDTKLIDANCSERSFSFTGEKSTSIENELQITLSLSNLLTQLRFPSQLEVQFTVHPCPIGFNLTTQGVCNCTTGVSRANVSCDIDSLSIRHTGQLWIGTYYNASTSIIPKETLLNDCIVNERCFFYCTPNAVTFMMNDTDSQCIDNRALRMCGSCRVGYSLLLGSNRCGQCLNSYNLIWTTILFAFMGILLVAFLIALNLTVSLGTMNGVLFYANIVKLFEPIFSRNGAVPFFSQVISWINLDFGFETCFYNGMDKYAKEWLQFLFPFYLWTIIIVIIVLCRLSIMISRLVGSNAVPVLATLLLLSYTKLIRSVVTILHKRDIIIACGEIRRLVTVWYEDPTVDYGRGKHVVLFVFAILLFLLFILPYTSFLVLNPLFEKLSKYKLFNFWNRIKPIIDAYSGPMKDRYRSWPGFLLVARLLILLSVTLADSVIDVRDRLLAILLAVLVSLFSLGFCFRGVYRNFLHDIIEVWFLLNLSIMVALAIAITDDNNSLIWYSACIAVFTFSFAGIIVYHLHLRLAEKGWYMSLTNKLMIKFKKQKPPKNMSMKDLNDEPKELSSVSTTNISVDNSDINRHRAVTDLFDDP